MYGIKSSLFSSLLFFFFHFLWRINNVTHSRKNMSHKSFVLWIPIYKCTPELERKKPGIWSGNTRMGQGLHLTFLYQSVSGELIVEMTVACNLYPTRFTPFIGQPLPCTFGRTGSTPFILASPSPTFLQGWEKHVGRCNKFSTFLDTGTKLHIKLEHMKWKFQEGWNINQWLKLYSKGTMHNGIHKS